jgi:hypothetical protein
MDNFESKQNEFKQFLAKLALKFDWNHVHNCLFLACILNDDYKKAELIYENDLNISYDLIFLKRFCGQLDGKILSSQRKNISNILKFKYFINDDTLLKEIKKIIESK